MARASLRIGSGNPDDLISATISGYVLVSDLSAISDTRTRVAEIPFFVVLPISTVTGATDSMISLICAGSAPRSIKEAMIMSPDAPMNGSKIRQVMVGYVCAGVHNGAGSRSRGLHESVKRVGVDVNSHRKYIMGDEGLAFTRVGFPAYDGWATS